MGNALPFDGQWYGQLRDRRRPAAPPADRDSAGYQIVSPSYLPAGLLVAMGAGSLTPIRLAVRRSIVDEEFVRRFLRGRSVFGTAHLHQRNDGATASGDRGRSSVSSGRSRSGPTSRNRAARLRADRAELVVEGDAGSATDGRAAEA